MANAASGLREHLHRSVAGVFPEVGPCALVGYPAHGNIGDHILWLGQSELLRSIGMRIEHVCDDRTYSPAKIRAECPSGPIVLTGGGNTGDIWPAVQRFRERILQDFPERRIVQLPQSVSFGSPAAAARFGELMRAHGNAVFFTRDAMSRDALLTGSGVDSILCPDVAFALELSGARRARKDVEWILRTDKEAARSGAVPEARDWEEKHSIRTFAAKGYSLASPLLGGFSPSFGEAISRSFLRKGISLVSSGRVLVTDRLHAAILSTLLGVPRVAIDNSYGKVHGYLRTWFDGDPDTALATSVEEARALAAGFAARSQ